MKRLKHGAHGVHGESKEESGIDEQEKLFLRVLRVSGS
jgi:hypothetical protein